MQWIQRFLQFWVNPVKGMEGLFRRLTHPYLDAVLVPTCLVLLFVLFSFCVPFYKSEVRGWNWVAVQPFLIGLEILGLYYLFRKMRQIFAVVLPGLLPAEEVRSLQRIWKNRFYRAVYYYLLVLALLALPLIYTVTHTGAVTFSDQPASCPDQNIPGSPVCLYPVCSYPAWGILFDIYNSVYYGFKIFLLGAIIWIGLHLVLLIQDMGREPCQQHLRLHLMAADPSSGLKPIHDLVTNFVMFYFLCITLENINSISAAYPTGKITDFFGIIFFLALIALGFCLFVYGINSIRVILRRRIDEKMKELSEYYQVQEQQLMALMREDTEGDTLGRMNLIKARLDVLYTQRERLLQLYSENKGYTPATLLQFGSSFILSLIVFLTQVFTFLEDYGGFQFLH